MCLTLVGVVKDRIDDFRGFPKEKGNAQETIGRLDSVLKYVSVESLMSVSSSFAESKALSSVLDDIKCVDHGRRTDARGGCVAFRVDQPYGKSEGS